MPLEAVLCTADGKLLQLDGTASSYQMARHHTIPSSSGADDRSMGCEYMQHPRCVLLPQRKTLAIFDLRTSTHGPSSVLWAGLQSGNSNEVLHAATVHRVSIVWTAVWMSLAPTLLH
eukprot:m.887095 g.887095  ORF g.887095 m.887095 type:complete len:117 (+) comp23635_c0_seq1:176-526(+)